MPFGVGNRRCLGAALAMAELQIVVAEIEGDASASTVEQLASGPHIVAWARAEGWAGSTGEELADAYRRGDALARAAIEAVVSDDPNGADLAASAHVYCSESFATVAGEAIQDVVRAFFCTSHGFTSRCIRDNLLSLSLSLRTE